MCIRDSLRGEWKSSVLNTCHSSDRLLMIKLSAEPVDLCIVMVYFPTTSSNNEDIELMYEQIEELFYEWEDILGGHINMPKKISTTRKIFAAPELSFKKDIF